MHCPPATLFQPLPRLPPGSRSSPLAPHSLASRLPRPIIARSGSSPSSLAPFSPCLLLTPLLSAAARPAAPCVFAAKVDAAQKVLNEERTTLQLKNDAERAAKQVGHAQQKWDGEG